MIDVVLCVCVCVFLICWGLWRPLSCCGVCHLGSLRSKAKCLLFQIKGLTNLISATLYLMFCFSTELKLFHCGILRNSFLHSISLCIILNHKFLFSRHSVFSDFMLSFRVADFFRSRHTSFLNVCFFHSTCSVFL